MSKTECLSTVWNAVFGNMFFTFFGMSKIAEALWSTILYVSTEIYFCAVLLKYVYAICYTDISFWHSVISENITQIEIIKMQ